MAFKIHTGDPEVVLLALLYSDLPEPWKVLRDMGVSWERRRTIAEKFKRYHLASENPWRGTDWGREVFRRYSLALTGVYEVTMPDAEWRRLPPGR